MRLRRYSMLNKSLLPVILIMTGCSLHPPVVEPPPPAVQTIPEAPSRELRGVWLTRFEYSQYSRTHDQDSIRTYIKTIIDSAADANFNVIFFQVRGSGDAYYRSDIEPWGPLLTGTFGEDPGWDPLAYALDLAHARGLELHAWLNTFPAWRGIDPPPETTPRSPYLVHPEWVVSDSAGQPMPLSEHYVSFSPAIPGVQDYIISVARDIVDRYNVDGLHFDYIRFPEGAPEIGYSHDSISVALFNSDIYNPLKLDWADWEREQLDVFVSRLYNTLTAEKPKLKVSAAVIGSYWRGRWNAYRVVYQDPRRWTEWGKMDFIAPMIYWPRSHPTQPFMVRSSEYRDEYVLDRYVFPGIGSYRYNEIDKPDYTWAEAEGQIDDLRRSQFSGMVFFHAGSLIDHFGALKKQRFTAPAGLPPMEWKGLEIPATPANLQVKTDAETGTILSWDPPSDSVYRYLVYCSEDTVIDSTRGNQLYRIVSGQKLQTNLIDPPKQWKTLGVSAVNAAWVESPLTIYRRED
ncbi:MAG: family 10 glycosylhydrolase [FCB group bacterium]|nr:family 10 glycosylhydrolase [FCB group bacterium]